MCSLRWLISCVMLCVTVVVGVVVGVVFLCVCLLVVLVSGCGVAIFCVQRCGVYDSSCLGCGVCVKCLMLHFALVLCLSSYFGRY